MDSQIAHCCTCVNIFFLKKVYYSLPSLDSLLLAFQEPALIGFSIESVQAQRAAEVLVYWLADVDVSKL